jgi:hypothetical protein
MRTSLVMSFFLSTCPDILISLLVLFSKQASGKFRVKGAFWVRQHRRSVIDLVVHACNSIARAFFNIATCMMQLSLIEPYQKLSLKIGICVFIQRRIWLIFGSAFIIINYTKIKHQTNSMYIRRGVWFEFCARWQAVGSKLMCETPPQVWCSFHNYIPAPNEFNVGL